MSLSIPDFARRIAPLNDVLEDVYAKSGKRKNKSIRKIALRTCLGGLGMKGLSNIFKTAYGPP